ncbi:MAG: hypothetical protein ON057_002064 [Glomeribacter sp. 1016415]|nr:hypothetical protein [Glomeribacter sp. 1016415]
MNLQQKIIKPKLGLLALAKQLGNVSSACKCNGSHLKPAMLAINALSGSD